MKGMNIPLVNSLNLTAGIEKNWHPIVMQVEGYLYTYFKQLSPETAKTGPGVRVKLLYQIGENNRNKYTALNIYLEYHQFHAHSFAS